MFENLRFASFVMLSRRLGLTSLAFCAACLLGPGLPAQVRVSGFKPSSSGLHFLNRFPHVPDLTVNILGNQVPVGDASNGLCGGMVYAVRDYFEAGLLPPPDRTSPDTFSRPTQVLFDYIVKRLFDSFDIPGGIVTYLHLMDPALPDHETDLSRIGLAPHGRAWVMIVEQWPLIKADLDAGVLSPIALVLVKSLSAFDMGENHQVLAYGYDLSGPNLTIHVYDPNYADLDDVTISLSLADPQHTTDVTLSNGKKIFCFFRTRYAFDSAAPLTICSTVPKSGTALVTGVDEAGQLIPNGIADTTFLVRGPGAGAGCATVVPDDAFPIGPWIGSSPRSKWIGLRKLSSNGPPGRYSFVTQLDLPAGTDVAGLGITGTWASDDLMVDVLVNGLSTGISGPGNFTELTPFPAMAGVGLFRSGRNTIEFIVENGGTGGENPIGLRVEATVGTVAQAGLVRPFDLNQDGRMELSDSVSLLGFLFLGKPSALPCGDGTAGDPSNKMLADYNGDGEISLSDAVAALSFLFLGGAPPAAGQVCLPIEGCPAGAGGSCL